MALLAGFLASAWAQVEEIIPSRPRLANFPPATPGIVKTTVPAQQAREDRRFLKDAAAAGRFEAEAARLALTRATHPAVRRYAATLAAHHTDAGPQLQYLLHVRDLAAPMLSNDQRKALNRLAKIKGAKFDHAFMEVLGIRNRQETVQAFERASGVTRDAQLHAWIERTLPALRQQLATLEREWAGAPPVASGSRSR